MRTFEDYEDDILVWAHEKGIFEKSDSKTQCLKFLSEAGEVADEVAKGRIAELEMEIGDVLVTLVLLGEMEGISLTSAIEKALNKISKRKGEMVNGVFIREDQ